MRKIMYLSHHQHYLFHSLSRLLLSLLLLLLFIAVVLSIFTLKTKLPYSERAMSNLCVYPSNQIAIIIFYLVFFLLSFSLSILLSFPSYPSCQNTNYGLSPSSNENTHEKYKKKTHDINIYLRSFINVNPKHSNERNETKSIDEFKNL